MARNGKHITWELSKTAGKQLAILVKRYRLTAAQITELLNAAGEYAITSHKQGMAAMEASAELIGEETMAQIRAQNVAYVTPGDLRVVIDQMFPRKHGERRKA